MKIININPNEIIIQENLSHTIENEFLKFEDYLNKTNKEDKYVIAYLYNNLLIAIDGNKLCTICRVLNMKVSVIVLISESDFKEFSERYKRNIGSNCLYTSRLLEWKNIDELKEVLNFGSITEKDYFYTKSYQVDLQNCLKSNFSHSFNHDIEYLGLTDSTKELLGIKIDSL